MKIRILSIILCLSMLFSTVALTSCSDAQESIVILYENDMHCATEGYSKLAAMKDEMKGVYDHVGVVSAGDFAQGGTLININILDAEKMMKAHENPDLYPDLVVRVTGFTAYFASLSPEFRALVVERFLTT